LRGEPGEKRIPDGSDFVLFDEEALRKLQRILGPEAEVELKIYDEAFWEALEDDLYEGDENCGSHSQTAKKAYSCAAGCAAGANRTEVMNLFADLLGFHDDDEGKGAYWSYQIWKEQYLEHTPPNPLAVRYGFGREFKADVLWQQKKEANVAEALIGALHCAGCEKLARAACGLCFLSYVATPCTVLPSNWAMAEKWLGIREKESEGWAKDQAWYKQHLDFDSFEQDMDSLLAL